MNRKELYDRLVEMEICDKFKEAPELMLKGDDEKIIEMLDTLDAYEFIGQHEVPKPAFLLAEFKDISKAGYVIKNYAEYTINPDRIKTHFVNCLCTINVPDYYVGYIYVSNNSDVVLVIGNFVDIKVVFYDGSHARIDDSIGGIKSKVNVKYKQKGYEI